ncbi:predicted protein [Botrytis cinerea T4]|uniref:Uncharacterized protein n=1 Tax=Botryotinia fuckeliana (strain T4) TaxID=999810 RepID=G2XZ38_BOTF4|nr:predicted protein [Botrytis cinerea T4]
MFRRLSTPSLGLWKSTDNGSDGHVTRQLIYMNQKSSYSKVTLR